MKVRKYTDLEKEQLIKEVKDCGSAILVSQKHNIPRSTLQYWIKGRPRQKVSSTQKSLKNLEKKISDQELQIKILEDLLKKTNQAWLGG